MLSIAKLEGDAAITSDVRFQKTGWEPINEPRFMALRIANDVVENVNEQEDAALRLGLLTIDFRTADGNGNRIRSIASIGKYVLLAYSRACGDLAPAFQDLSRVIISANGKEHWTEGYVSCWRTAVISNMDGQVKPDQFVGDVHGRLHNTFNGQPGAPIQHGNLVGLFRGFYSFNTDFGRPISHPDSGAVRLQSLSYINNANASYAYGHQRGYEGPESPFGHLPLGLKILFGSPFLPIGIWIGWRSLNALEWWEDGFARARSVFGILGGAAIFALGWVIMIL